MSTIAVHKHNGTTPIRETLRHPWKALRDLFRRDSATPTHFGAPFDMSSTLAPALDMRETAEGYVLQADVPGVAEKDLDISLTANVLTIKGQREAEHEEEGDTLYVYERSHGSFLRSLTLPEGCDLASLRAELSDGLLTISLRKTAEAQPRRVPVKTS